jgi:hypothetical protein
LGLDEKGKLSSQIVPASGLQWMDSRRPRFLAVCYLQGCFGLDQTTSTVYALASLRVLE